MFRAMDIKITFLCYFGSLFYSYSPISDML